MKKINLDLGISVFVLNNNAFSLMFNETHPHILWKIVPVMVNLKNKYNLENLD